MLRIGSPNPAVLPYVRAMKEFFIPEVTRRVEAETTHTITFVEAIGGTVAKPDQVVETLDAGALHVAGTVVAYEPSKLYLLNFGYFTPFSATDPLVQARVSRRMAIEVPQIQASFDSHGVELLAFGVLEDYGIGST